MPRILCSEPADGGPIEVLAAQGKQAQKSIVQQASERHRNAKTLGGGQREPDVLESKRCSESCRLKLGFGDEVAIDFVCRYVEHRGGEEFDVRPRVVTSWPALTRLAAIAAPMLPSPMNPSFMASTPSKFAIKRVAAAP
jgi:hypothetical protein